MLHLIAGGLILGTALAVSGALWAWAHGMAWLMGVAHGQVPWEMIGETVFILALVVVAVWAWRELRRGLGR